MACAFASVMVLASTPALAAPPKQRSAAGPPTKPNILFVIIDDAGSDQFSKLNPSGPDLAATPVFDSIWAQGVAFTNTWAMPQCSPSRVSMMTGRYPLRTGVYNACLSKAPPRSQASPYEFTTPRLLATAGYASGYIGKFHLGNDALNVAGDAYPLDLGFPSFDGTNLGGPALIDVTLAGQMAAPAKDALPMYSCGFPVDAATNAPAVCSCGYPDQTWVDSMDAVQCLASGGVPLVALDGTPILKGSAKDVGRVNFQANNGFFNNPRVVVSEGSAPVITNESKYSASNYVDRAVSWITSRPAGTPWMCTVGFVNIHDPYQPAPADLLPPGASWPAKIPYLCDEQAGYSGSLVASQHGMTNQMLTSTDREIGRLLVQTGLAKWSGSGITLVDSNTTVIVVGDNGSFLNAVRFPFDPLHAKGYVNQTGVSVPLVVAGAKVVAPGRTVDAMVNVTDLYQLCGELAGLDVRATVPASHTLDCQSMIGYLKNPKAAPVRTINFTQNGTNLTFPDGLLRACLITSVALCTDSTATGPTVCESLGGTWYDGYATCCDLRAANIAGDFSIIPTSAVAAFDGRYKLIVQELPSCDQGTVCAYEFYDLTTAPFAKLLGGRGIDFPSASLLPTTADCNPDALTPEQDAAFTALQAYLNNPLAQGTACPGDGNLDRVVDNNDLAEIMNWWGEISVYDFNNDGTTDGNDLAMLLNSWGPCANE